MTYQLWNWLLKNWPNFSYDKEVIEALEYSFFQNNGSVLGVLKHINDDEKDNLLVDIQLYIAKKNC